MPPYNGSGAFTPSASDFPAVPNTVIESTKFNNVINDVSNGLSTAITKDGQTTVTQNIPFNGKKLTNIGAGSVAGDAINYTQLTASSGSSILGFIQSGTGATATTVQAALRFTFNVKYYGAVGDGVTNDTTAVLNTINAVKAAGGGTVYFPEGTYLCSSGQFVISTAAGWPSESACVFTGDGPTASIIKLNGLTGTLFDWGSGVYGGFYKLGFDSTAVDGHTSQTIDGFVTTTTGNGGCTATSSVAIKHAYNGVFVIDSCNFYRFFRAIWMDLGYNRAVSNSAISWCNVGLGTYGAATINKYSNLRIERNAIGMSFAIASAHDMDAVVSEANYAGCDVLIGTFCHSLDFNKLYCEASPKQVYMLGGAATTQGTGLTVGTRFRNCNSLSIEVASNIGDVTVEDSIMQAIPITQNSGQGSYYINNLWQLDGGGNRIPATGYSISAPAFAYVLNQRDCINGNWTPLATSLTVVGTPTYSGSYQRIGNMVFCTLLVTSTTTTAATANITYFTGLPFTPGTSSTCSAVDPNTVADLGDGLISTAARVYVPSWTARAAVAISFSYMI